MAAGDLMPNSRWPVRRVAAVVLTLLLAGLLCYALLTGVRHRETIWLLCVGIILGAIYSIRGSVPLSVLRLSERDGEGITADHDPRNLPLKVYGPILLAAIVLACLLYWYSVGRRH